MGGQESKLSGIEGFQVARVMPNSPAHIAGLLPFFDIIVAVDNLPIDRDNTTFFKDYVKRHQEESLKLCVYNLRIQKHREVTITPSDQWGGVGLLGCSINWECAEKCLESTWHIVDVAAHSPAMAADLMPHRDYILGMQPLDELTITMFKDGSDFHSRLEEWRTAREIGDKSAPSQLLFLTYDCVNDAIKEVMVQCGKGSSLGIDVANGYLHMVPFAPESSRLPVLKVFYSGPAASPVNPENPLPMLVEPSEVPKMQPQPAAVGAEGARSAFPPAPASVVPQVQPLANGVSAFPPLPNSATVTAAPFAAVAAFPAPPGQSAGSAFPTFSFPPQPPTFGTVPRT
jgi:hypothetical protein